MKVQWRLVDVKTNRAWPVGEEFEVFDCMETYFSTEGPMKYLEEVILCGTSPIKNPVGILGESPIASAHKSTTGIKKKMAIKTHADIMEKGQKLIDDLYVTPEMKDLIRRAMENSKLCMDAFGLSNGDYSLD